MNPNKRLVRKEILRTLKYAGRVGANNRLLLQSLIDAAYSVTPVDIDEHLLYLSGEGKEYIEIRTLHLGGQPDIISAVLTPRGMDLLERNIDPDPGIAE